MNTPMTNFRVYRNIDLGEISNHLIDDLKASLSTAPRMIPAEFLYDEQGSILFDELAASESYYLPKKEIEILENDGRAIADLVGDCEIFELGAGSSRKTRILLEAFVNEKKNITFHPIDINLPIMETGAQELREYLPGLRIDGLVGSFEDTLPNIEESTALRLFMFLGSSISQEEDDTLLRQVRSATKSGDFFLVAYDLQKDPEIIVGAYQNKAEEMVSLNVLTHLNRRFNGDFDLSAFELNVRYYPELYRNETQLRSLRDQKITLADLDFSITLKAGETIATGHQRKFTADGIAERLKNNGFKSVKTFMDERNWYAITLFVREEKG